MKFKRHPDYKGERLLVFNDDHDELMISLDADKYAFLYVNAEGPVWLKPKQARALANAILKELK